MPQESISKGQVVTSLAWKMLERFLTQGVGLVVQIILARILLPKDFGSLAIMTAIINYLGIFVQSGLSATIIQKPDLDDKDISSLTGFSFLLALILYMGVFFFAPKLGVIYQMEDIVWPIRVLSLSLFISAINSVQIGVLSRKMKFKLIFIRSILAVIIAGVVAIALALKGFGIWSLIAYTILNTLIAVLAMCFTPEGKLMFGLHWDRIKSIYSFTIKVIFTNLVSGTGDAIRTMVIGKKYTVDQLAYYDKAYTYSNTAIQIVTSSISGVLLPTFSRQQDDVERLRGMVRRSVRLTLFVSLPLLVLVAVVAKPLVLLLLTEKWAPCIPFLMLFCIFRLCSPVSTIDKQVYYSIGRSEIGLYYEIGLLVANIIMLLITVPIGISAIAIGATIVEFLGTFAIFLISRKVFLYTLRQRFQDLIKPLLNTLVMVMIITPLSLLDISNIGLLASQSILGVVVYYLMAKLTKDDNVDYIMSIIKK